MSNNELRKEVWEWAKENLVGKKIYLSGIKKEIVFNRNGIRHDISRVYSNYEIKLKSIYFLEDLLKNSIYISKESDKKGRKEVKWIYNFNNIAEIDGKEYRFWLKIRETEHGCFFYDHGLIT